MDSLDAVDLLREMRAKVRRNAESYAQTNADAKVAECRAQERALDAAIAALLPSAADGELPELPEPASAYDLAKWGPKPDYYTADQMEAYARAAIAASRPSAADEPVDDKPVAYQYRARIAGEQWKTVEPSDFNPEHSSDIWEFGTLAAALSAPPPAAGITAEWVMGYLPSGTGQSDERADAFQLCREEVAHAFAEWAALHPGPAAAPTPEGETPADARMLRKANHGLVDELDRAEALLRRVKEDGGASQTLLLEIEAFLNRGW